MRHFVWRVAVQAAMSAPRCDGLVDELPEVQAEVSALALHTTLGHTVEAEPRA
jgi:hypothetical protein